MKCPPIEIPDPLASALNAGELVIFAGAGVSMGPPAGLGNFRKLAETIAHRLGVPPPGPEELSDRFLARLSNEKPEVHEVCRQIFAGAKQPNEIHRLLLRLFRPPGDVRIVTSNFDPLFSVAAVELGLTVPIHLAPALPLGDDFGGLVHLHGTALGPAAHLILTADDFGRAYMTRGWARTFLLDLFARYTVLFVGYRHADFPVEYLAFGLRGNAKKPRYALDCDELDRWVHYGIEPIRYDKMPSTPDPHSNLTLGLRSWMEEISRSPIDTEVRLEQLLHSPSEPSGVAEDFLFRTILDFAGAGHFVRYAEDTGSRWVEWLDAKGKLKPYLHADREGADEATLIMANWIGRKLAHSEEGLGLSLVERHDGRLGDLVWDAIAHELARSPDLLAKPEASRWVVFLLNPAGNLNTLNFLLQAAAKQKVWPIALILIDRLTTPTVKLLQDFPGTPRRAVLEVVVEGDVQHFLLIWQESIVPSLPEFAAELAPILEGKIRQAHQIAVLSGKADSFVNPVLYTRTAVEFDEHPMFARDLELLLNLFAEVLNALHQRLSGNTSAWAQRLLDSSSPILLRFGLYVLKQCTSLAPSEKLKWLIERSLFYPPAFGGTHELYELLKDIYPKLKPEERSDIWTKLEAALPSTQDTRPEAQQRGDEIDKVCWHLAKENPDDVLAKDAWKRLEARNPGRASHEPWKPGEYMREFSGSAGPRSPRPVAELLAQPASDQLDFLLGFKGEDWPKPSRSGLLSAVAAAARENKEWGSGLMRTLAAHELWTSDLWTACFFSLRWSDLPQADREWFLTISAPHLAKDPDLAEGTARFLFQNRSIETLRGLGPSELRSLLAFSIVLWEEVRGKVRLKDSNPRRTDWLDIAINKSCGWIVEFWLIHQQRLMENTPEGHPGWPKELERALAQVVSGETDTDLLALASLVRNLAFVRRIDPAWTSSQLYPCFDFARFGDKAWVVWTTFLGFGTWDRDVALELKPLLQAAFPKLGHPPENLLRHYLGRMAALAASGYFDVNAGNWLQEFLRSITPAQRAVWTQALARSIAQASAPERLQAWESWLKGYWSDRLDQGVPAVESAEADGFFRLAVSLKELFAEAVPVLLRCPPPEIGHFLPLDLVEGSLAEEHPEAFLKILAWALGGVKGSPLLSDKYLTLHKRLPRRRALLPYWEACCQRLSQLSVPQGRDLLAEGQAWFTEADF